tara:strand:+ start:53 stop:637 length:585 start_codon:yes stop_codon:yes gene_type:complete
MKKPPEHLDLFPIPVGKYDLSFLDLDKISEIIKQVKVEPHDLLGDSDSSYGTEFSILYYDQLKFLKEEVDNCLQEYTQRVGLEEVDIIRSWYNNMSTGKSIKLHRHEGSVISGAFYLKVNDNSVPLRFKSPVLPSKMIDMFITPTQYACPYFDLKPTIGQLVLFPSWLEHETAAECGERMVISFNTFYKPIKND